MEQTRESLAVGDQVEVEIIAAAHGGHFIARHRGQVLFVRHGIPGEKVRVEVTSVLSKVTRADVIEVLSASPHRVEAPCEFAHPGGCGGCDFQHITLAYQLEVKASLIREQFSRIGKIDLDELAIPVVVSSAGDDAGLNWRTRMDFAISPEGRIGFYKSRSNEVQEIDDCLIAVDEMGVSSLAAKRWNGDARIEVATSSTGQTNITRGGRSLSGPTQLHEEVNGFSYTISPLSFWQAHKSAPSILVTRALELLGATVGDTVCDLYAGVGLFTAAIAQVVGPTGKVHFIESDRRAISDATKIFKGRANVAIHPGTVEQNLAKIVSTDLVLLDPPRTGADELVILGLLKLSPRTIVYVSCDPASLARDAKLLTEGGYSLDSVDGFDLFPMTAHVETMVKFSRG